MAQYIMELESTLTLSRVVAGFSSILVVSDLKG